MKNKRPFILISNDDGYEAKGIRFLCEVLQPLADLLVMAPSEARSGMGCAITSKQPVFYKEVHQEEGLHYCYCTGTPVDCIKLALDQLVDRKPDLVIGGINHGDNSAVNVHYSGTMGVVLEGCMKGIPSIGFSLDNHAADADFSPLAPYILQITKEVLAHGLPEGTCLNVNFPNTPLYKGVKVARMAQGEWTNEWEKRTYPRGGSYFWLTGNFCLSEHPQTEADRCLLTDGYVAITPVKVDMTDNQMMEELKTWNFAAE